MNGLKHTVPTEDLAREDRYMIGIAHLNNKREQFHTDYFAISRQPLAHLPHFFLNHRTPETNYHATFINNPAVIQ